MSAKSVTMYVYAPWAFIARERLSKTLEPSKIRYVLASAECRTRVPRPANIGEIVLGRQRKFAD